MGCKSSNNLIMSLETRTYVITAESSVLDELEGVLKMAQAQIGVKTHNPPRVEQWAKEELEKNKPQIEKEQDRMFKEMLIFNETSFKAPDLPNNLDNTIPHF